MIYLMFFSILSARTVKYADSICDEGLKLLQQGYLLVMDSDL